jgi:dTDP-4-dehydrorhamnose 3,5-epimerase
MNLPEQFSYLKAYTQPDPNSIALPATLTSNTYRPSRHIDARGSLVEVHRQSWHDHQVQQVYLSETLPGVIKAWHLHMEQTDLMVCVKGRVLVAWCPLSFSPRMVQERVLDAATPEALAIPPGAAHGWMALGNESAVVMNMPNREYTGLDEYRRDPHEGPAPDTPYDWRRCRDG